MNPILEVEALCKRFGSTTVLTDVSFAMAEGERVCILGPSGCGKSTLLQIVAGILRSDAGSIRMDGRVVESPTAATPPDRRPVNMVFQDYALWPHMSVRSNIVYGMRHRKVPTAQRDGRLTRLVELLHLQGLMDRLPAQLSGGQQQRVGIARALATEPRILLLDEPLSNLDIKLRTQTRHELAVLLRSLGITALHVTHDAMEAFALADRILILHDGNVVQLAPPQELFERPATPWVAELMGYHNRLQASLLEVRDEVAHVRVGEQILQGLYRPVHEPDSEARSPTVAMTHQDTLRLLAPGTGDADAARAQTEADNRLQALVTGVTYEGARWRVSVQTPDRQELHTLHSQPLETGTSVTVAIPRLSTMVFSAG